MVDTKDEQQKDTPSYLTEEAANEKINSAITNRTKAIQKEFQKSLDEFRASLLPKQPEEVVKEVKPNTEELIEMRKKFQLMEQKEAVSREKVIRSEIKDNLLSLGVEPHLIKAAIAQLLHEDKLVSYNDQDQIVFKKFDEQIDLTKGLTEWVKSDGKIFLPQKGAAGSGSKKPSSTNFSTDKNLSREQFRSEFGSYLKENKDHLFRG